MFKNQFVESLKIALGLVLGVGGLILLTKIIGPIPLAINQITTNKQSSFEVSGTAEMSVVPDKADVTLGITVTESTVKGAQDKANTVISKVIGELTKLEVDKKDIKTTNYSLSPTYDYSVISSSRPKITGYSVYTNLDVKFKDFTKLNEAIDAATVAGANQVGGLSFGVSEEKMKEYTKDLRKQAIDDAKDKANELAGLAGMKLGKVINVVESQFGAPVPMLRTMDVAVGKAESVPTSVESGSTTLNYSVTLSFETL